MDVDFSGYVHKEIPWLNMCDTLKSPLVQSINRHRRSDKILEAPFADFSLDKFGL